MVAGQLTNTREVDPGEELLSGWHVDVLWELLALCGVRAVDAHASDGKEFETELVKMCHGGHVGVLRELLGLADEQTCGVHAREGFDARWACQSGSFLLCRGCSS
ncbi:unnamed protein product [Symbiodinium sp. KB8]|nr:unnamed protein product [Symbiodinium sp. KB8]